MSTSALNGTRDIMLLSDGQQMIVTASFSSRLLFFNRSSPTSHSYNYSGYQNIASHSSHGLFYVSDSLFYLTSWGNSAVYKYTSVESATGWSETLAVTASPVPSSNGNHVTVDGCERCWLSLGAAGVQILDNHGVLLGSLYPTGSNIFDVLMLDNYVMYLSDYAGNPIIRLDLNTQC